MSTVVELTGNNQQSNVQATPNTTGSEFQSNAVLQRMKEMEQQMQDMKSNMKNLEAENNKKNEAIKQLEAEKVELSAERRKDMEQILESAVNDWLNSLKGISDDVRQQFKNGITGLAQKADIKNHAWEVICNASQSHKENVNKIEELVKLCNEKEKTIETLLHSNSDPSFKMPSSRFTAPDHAIGTKRPRTSDEPSSDTSAVLDRSSSNKEGKDAWDHFSSILLTQSQAQYY